MILVRPAREDDLPRLVALHGASGFDYTAPDWMNLLSCVIERDGEVTSAAFLRKTAETYLLIDPGKRKREQLGDLILLHKELVEPAEREGYSDINCWLPPEIEKPFGRLLLHLGWQKQLWSSYSRKVE